MEVNTHPYSPKDLYLPDFAPNLLYGSTIFGAFTAAAIFVFSTSWILCAMVSKTTKLERLLIGWFTFNGLLHLVPETYFLFRPDYYKDQSGSFFAELWKEVSKGDSRYVSLDPTILALEAVTISIVGPACLLAVYAIATGKHYRYALQFAISLVHFYGLVIYYFTGIFNKVSFSASSYYYYAYFIGANSPWLLIPFLIIVSCWKKIVCEFEGTNKNKVQ